MPYKEDKQPNEMQNYNQTVPIVRSSKSFTGPRGRGRGNGFNNDRGRGALHIHASPSRRRERSPRPKSRAQSSFEHTHSGLRRTPLLGCRETIPERPHKKPREESVLCADAKHDFFSLHSQPFADTRTFQVERPIRPDSRQPELHREPPALRVTDYDSRLQYTSIHPFPITTSCQTALLRTIPSASSYLHLDHNVDPIHDRKSSSYENGRDIAASMSYSSTPSAMTTQPISVPTMEITPTPTSGSDIDFASIKRAPTFRSGTLKIELPPHVRPLNPERFLREQFQVQQSADVPQSHASSTHKGDSRLHRLQKSELVRHNLEALAGYPMIGQDIPQVLSESAQPPLGHLQRVQDIQMRREPHDKPRRLLALPSGAMLSVTIRGSLDLLAQDPLRYTSLRTQFTPYITEDACTLFGTHHPTIVIGRNGNTQQVSLFRIKEGKVRDLGSFDRPYPADKKGGVSAVCHMMQPGSFAVGGYDHIVNLWSLPEERDAPPVGSAPIAVKHASAIHSLLPVRDTSQKLLTGGADCALSVYDLPSERTVHTLKLSNQIYQLHPVASPYCVLIELAHREFQFEIRDRRMVQEQPAIRFGYPSTKVHGRYTKGGVESHIFVCGGNEDGCVRLWDMRNTSNILQTVPCFSGKKVVQTHISTPQITVCSEDHHITILKCA